MTTTCKCGGRFRRNDIIAAFDKELGRTMYSDRSSLVATWQYNKCLAIRIQAKRQPKIK